jgi:hypothetical protein
MGSCPGKNSKRGFCVLAAGKFLNISLTGFNHPVKIQIRLEKF